MTCYFRRLKQIFKKAGIEVTREKQTRSDRTIHGALNLSFDFVHFDKLLNFRLISCKDVILGVKNGILCIASLIKPCNQSDNSFIKNKPEPWLSSKQRVWCGGLGLHCRLKLSTECCQ